MKQKWNAMLPKGKGFIQPNGSTIELQPGIWTADMGYIWGLSTYHQLHCLWLLMDGYNSAVLARPINNKHHIRHCFDYIRQVLLCVSDVALEGRDPEGGKEDAPIHGIGAKRVCKDSRELFEWAEERRTSEAMDLVGGT